MNIFGCLLLAFVMDFKIHTRNPRYTGMVTWAARTFLVYLAFSIG